MKNSFIYLLFSFIICVSFNAYGQTRTSNQLLNAVYNKMQKAKDYSVDANIKVDLPFIKMLPINAKIYFKQKDKFKVESKSIAIVPRQGFDQITKMLADTNKFSTLIQGAEMLGTIKTTVVNIIPLSDTSDLILGKIWVDPIQNIVLKSQLTTKSNGTILTEFTYGSQTAFGLPDMMVFSVDVKKFKVPKGVAADLNNKPVDDKQKDNKKGKIYIKLSNYQINKGIDDSKFKK
jgi:hypothetical protein